MKRKKRRKHENKSKNRLTDNRDFLPPTAFYVPCLPHHILFFAAYFLPNFATLARGK